MGGPFSRLETRLLTFVVAQRSTEPRARRAIRFINMFTTYYDDEMDNIRRVDPHGIGAATAALRRDLLPFRDYTNAINHMALLAAQNGSIDNGHWIWLETRSSYDMSRSCYQDALRIARSWTSWTNSHTRLPWGPVGHLVDRNQELTV